MDSTALLPSRIQFGFTIRRHTPVSPTFWGEGLFVFPLMLLYIAIGYRVFRGKVGSASMH